VHLHLPAKPDLERPAFFHCRSVEKPLHLTDANDELGSTLKCEPHFFFGEDPGQHMVCPRGGEGQHVALTFFVL